MYKYTLDCIVTLPVFHGYLSNNGYWMNMNPWQKQIDVINGFEFICKIEGLISYEQVEI